MPKTKRDELKRKIAQVYEHLSRGIIYLGELHVIFEPVHPEHAQMLMLLAQALTQVQSNIEVFCIITWGKVPKHFDRWRL